MSSIKSKDMLKKSLQQQKVESKEKFKDGVKTKAPLHDQDGAGEVLKQTLRDKRRDSKEQLKEGVIKQKQMAPRQARKSAKKDLRITKRTIKEVKKEVKKELKMEATPKLEGVKSNLTEVSGPKGERVKNNLTERLDQKGSEELSKAKQRLKSVKVSHRKNKKLYRHAVKNDPTLIRNQVKVESKLRIKQDIMYKIGDKLKEDDILGEVVNTVQTANQTNRNMRTALKVTKQTAKLGGKVVNGTYGLGNRTYNLVRGKGFYRTPPDVTLRSKLLKKARQANRRMKAYANLKQFQASMTSQNAINVVKQVISKAVTAIVNNPITWGVLAVVIFIMIIIGAVVSNVRYSIVQDEHDLTESWVYMTKVDTEHNDDTNTFFSNIDDIMFYMNYEHEDYALKDNHTLTQTYEDYLSGLWIDLNGEKPNYALQIMEDLIKDKKSRYYMSDDDYSDFQEIKDEYGYQTLDGQLSFPFETEELTISRRYGYEGKNKEATLFEEIEVSTLSNTDIISPMDGTISSVSEEDSIEITLTDDYRLIVKGVSNARFVGGEVVREGEYLGQSTGTTLSIQYFSYQTEQAQWQSVNPAFYFPKVVYSQQTVLGIDFEASGLSQEVLLLTSKFIQAMKEEGMPEKYLPIVLAVAMQESGGRVPDVMQSSESLGLPPNTLGTDASIKQGVRYLWGNMRLIGIDLINQDEKYIKTAVQAYNYGVGFIPYTKANNYAYTQELATAFSMKMSGGTGAYGDSLYVPHVWRYITSGGQQNPGTGQFAYPLPNRLSSVSGFEYRINPITLVAEFHTGLDFAVGFGTEVYASADAVVMRATDVYDSYGINVVLKHKEGGYWTRYAHLSRAVVAEGGTVKKGQLIGYVGSTGASTGPHLHYEVMTSMYAGHVDPRGFIN